MALIMAVTALKGGAGKSVLASNLAACLYGAGHRVLAVDLDPQGTLRRWAAQGAEASSVDAPPVVGMEGSTLRRDLDKVASDFDAVVVDTPPQLAAAARAAMLVADLVVVPAVLSAPDVWATQETLDVLAEARGLRPELRAVIVPNRIDRTGLGKASWEALGELDKSVTVLQVGLGARVAYGEAMLAGRGVVDYAPSSLAATEVENVTAAVLAAVKGKPWRKAKRKR